MIIKHGGHTFWAVHEVRKIFFLDCTFRAQTNSNHMATILMLSSWSFFREEQEKLNIFVALMNLENLYGTQESLIKVFESALQQNEPKKVFFHLINIYTKSNKTEVRVIIIKALATRVIFPLQLKG